MLDRKLLRARARLIVALCAALTSASCSQFLAHRTVPMPAGSLAVAPLDAGRVAVLAGDEQSKAIFIVDLATGAVSKSFGTTREATGVAAQSGSGMLLVSIGGSANGRPFGSVERWSLEGVKEQVAPLSSRALGITRDIDGVSYALVEGAGDARAAVPIQDGALHPGRGIPLEAGARALQQCMIGASEYLVYTDGRGAVTVHGVDNGTTLKSDLAADGPECSSDGHVYAITKGFAASSIAVLGLPSLHKIASIPVSNDASALYATSDHYIMTLDATSRTSGLEFVPQMEQVKTAMR